MANWKQHVLFFNYITFVFDNEVQLEFSLDLLLYYLQAKKCSPKNINLGSFISFWCEYYVL